MRNLVLDQIKQEQVKLQQIHSETMGALHASAAKAFELAMEFKTKEVDAIVNALEVSRELTQVEGDEYIHSWTRVDFSTLIDVESEHEQELLAEYFQEHHFIYVDFKNDAVTQCIGPCLVINDDGDVLDQDSGKWVINRQDYESIAERNNLIEEYMDKTGYFPSVVQEGRYGVQGYVNTQRAV